MNTSLSIAEPHPDGSSLLQKSFLAVVGVGFLILLGSFSGVLNRPSSFLLYTALTCITAGTGLYAASFYTGRSAGVKNDYVWKDALTSRGILGWVLGVILTGIYVLLYWYPQFLGMAEKGHANTGLIGLFDPLSNFFTATPASQWFVYGTLYTVAIVSMGIKFLLKYRYSRYHQLRTVSVMGAQLFLAYIIPEILEGLNKDKPYFNKDIKYFWPLNYYFFQDWHLKGLSGGGNIGMFYLIAGLGMFIFVAPIATYFLGKRWYCSWICGCGGLAETAGDPFRHLSSKKLGAWQFERLSIHTVMILVCLMTAAVLYGYFSGSSSIAGLDIYRYFSQPYGFVIGALFSGIAGVGFYPLLGSRVWCRFGCPLAGYMGLIQRFKSRFRITTNGGQCISCGNCSTYCEQGIDVRWYAQRQQNIVRSSCVGCGICATVCPRGVLKLENGPELGRINEEPKQIGSGIDFSVR